MASPNPDPLAPTLAEDIRAALRPGKVRTVDDTCTTGHGSLSGQQFGAHVPDVSVSVDDVSGNPQAEHAHGVGTVHVGYDNYGRPVHAIPQRQARMIGDSEAHDFDHEARGIDTLFNAGHLRAQAHVQAANGDALAANLMGDQRSPAAQKRGRAGYRAAIDRATQNDDGK